MTPKNVVLKKLTALAGILWLLLAPVHGAMGAVLALPVVDLVLGLVASKRAGRPLTSSGLKRTVGKVFLYELTLILAYVTELQLTGDLLPAVKIVTGLIGMTELKSCLEHLEEISGQPVLQAILNKLTPPKDANNDPK